MTTEAIKQAMQEAEDAKMRAKAEKAYNEASTTAPSPRPAASAPKKMAKGGVTRADGCVTKGHTRGKMV